MSFTVLSERPHQALEALAIYRYLTSQQIVDLGISASRTVARDHVLRKLKQGRYPLIKTHDFGRWPGYGKIPHIHYLSPRGVKYLADINSISEKTIRYPKGGVQFTRDLFHRIAVIDCYIALRKWSNTNGYSFIHTALYFDKHGAQRGTGQVSDTRLELGHMGIIEPDGIFVLKRDGFVLPLILEVHRYPDSQRIAEQLNRHGYGLHIGALTAKYNDLKVSPVILSVHEKESSMRGAQKRLREADGFEPFSKGFVFNTVQQMKSVISQSWEYADGRALQIFSSE